MVRIAKDSGWRDKKLRMARKALAERIFFPEERGFALGLALHVTDIVIPELAKAAEDGPLPEGTFEHFADLFCDILATTYEWRLRRRVRSEFFDEALQHRWAPEVSGDTIHCAPLSKD